MQWVWLSPFLPSSYNEGEGEEPMPIIQAQGLTKTYRVFQKQPGLWASLRGLFHRTYKEVRAVADVSFSIEPGRSQKTNSVPLSRPLPTARQCSR